MKRFFTLLFFLALVVHDGQSSIEWVPQKITSTVLLPPLEGPTKTYEVLLISDANLEGWNFIGNCYGLSATFNGTHMQNVFISLDLTVFNESIWQPDHCRLLAENEKGENATLNVDIGISYSWYCISDQPNPSQFCMYWHKNPHMYCDITDSLCKCEQNYYGFYCRYCTANETCSGHGTCSHLIGLCDCEDNYFGENCSQFCEQNTTCNGHGRCSVKGTCDCSIDYYGEHCDIRCDSSTTCNDHGYCSSNGTCVCDQGYYGPHCEYMTCQYDCQYGTCNNQTGQCDCDPEYSGPNCACLKGNCQHGACTLNGTCACDTHYYGNQCSRYCGPNSCSYGECDEQGQCHCDSVKCVYGNCSGDVCVCQRGHYGPQCNMLCHSCVNGHCNQMDGQCVCNANYYAPDCSVYCDPRDSCSGHGSCDRIGQCSCDVGYFGNNCAIKSSNSNWMWILALVIGVVIVALVLRRCAQNRSRSTYQVIADQPLIN